MQHTQLVQAAQAAERDARAHPDNAAAAQRYREEAAAVLQRLRASWSPCRKELLLARQVEDAEKKQEKASKAREAAAESLRLAQEQADTAVQAEDLAENALTELRVELEAAQREAAKTVAQAANFSADISSAGHSADRTSLPAGTVCNRSDCN